MPRPDLHRALTVPFKRTTFQNNINSTVQAPNYLRVPENFPTADESYIGGHGGGGADQHCCVLF